MVGLHGDDLYWDGDLGNFFWGPQHLMWREVKPSLDYWNPEEHCPSGRPKRYAGVKCFEYVGFIVAKLRDGLPFTDNKKSVQWIQTLVQGFICILLLLYQYLDVLGEVPTLWGTLLPHCLLASQHTPKHCFFIGNVASSMVRTPHLPVSTVTPKHALGQLTWMVGWYC